MGQCGAKEAPQEKTKITAKQQAQINEATKDVERQVEKEVAAAAQELEAEVKAQEEEMKKAAEAKKSESSTGSPKSQKSSEKDPEAMERRRQAEAKYKKAHRRLNKLETLRAARNLGAINGDEFNAAVRRLHAATGNDATNPDNLHALPEGMQWFTTLLEVMWPSVQEYCKNYVDEWLEPLIVRLSAKYGVSCEVTHFDLGSNTPAFGPIEARYCTGLHGEPASEKKAVEIALGINIRSNMKFFMNTSMGQVGVQNYNFSGTLYFWLRPFIETSPFVGAVEMAFVNPPSLDMDWTGIAEGPFEETFRSYAQYYIKYYLDYYCVLPNNYVYVMAPTHPKVDAQRLKSPRPEGVLRLTITSVTNMPSPSEGLGKASRKYKPFIDIKVGGHRYKTPVAKDLSYPRWTGTDASHDFLVYHRDQHVTFVLKDQFAAEEEGDDPVSVGAVIGQAVDIAVNRLAKRRTVTLPLTKKGFPITDGNLNPTMITLTATWMSIDSQNAASKDCVALIDVESLEGVPAELHERTPFKVVAEHVGNDASRTETRPGYMKPDAAIDPVVVLKQIRQQADVAPKQIARNLGLVLPGSEELVEQALDQDGSRYTLVPGTDDEGGKQWWQDRKYLLDYITYPKTPKTARWGAKEPGSNAWPHPPKVSESEIEQRVAFYKIYEKFDNWCTAVGQNFAKGKGTSSPFYGAVLSVKAEVCPEGTPLQLLVVDKNEVVVGKTEVLRVHDVAIGEEPDMEGPLTITFTDACAKEGVAGQTCMLKGSISLRNLVEASTLPREWNLAADTIEPVKEFVEWWKRDEYVESWVDWVHAARSSLKASLLENVARGVADAVTRNDEDDDEHVDTAELLDAMKDAQLDPKKHRWLMVDATGNELGLADRETLAARHTYYLTGNEGDDAAGVTDEKEAALSDCLKAGALTWNDYDAIVSRLRGEPNGAASVAETLEWLNMLMIAMWPGINRYTVRTLKKSVGPSLEAKLQEYVGGMKLRFNDNVTLGKVPPAYGTIAARKVMVRDAKDEVPREYCEIFMQGIAFESEVDVGVTVSYGTSVQLGVQDVLFRGDLLLRLGPMIPTMPLIGAVQYVLPNPPELDLKLSGGLGDLVSKVEAAFPSLESISRAYVVDSCAAACAIPNYCVYPMVKDVDVTHLRYPTPIGILRIECKQALHLVAADVGVTGEMTSSDAYVRVKVGSTVRQTKPVTSLAPEWTREHDNVMTFIVYNEDQTVDIEVFDQDTMVADDTLGAVYHKVPCLGGGRDEIRRGLPVRTMRRLGMAILPLQEKVVDETLTAPGARHTVYELKDIIGKDGLNSVLVLQASWISADQEGDTNKAFIASATINSMREVSRKIEGPLKVRLSMHGKEITSREGTAAQEFPSCEDLLDQIGRYKESTEPKFSNRRIAKMLGLTEKLVDMSDDVRGSDAKLTAQSDPASGNITAASIQSIESQMQGIRWYKQATAMMALNRQLTEPQFNETMHLAFEAPQQAIQQGDRWSGQATLDILDKKDRVVGSKTFQVSPVMRVTGEFLIAMQDEGACYIDCSVWLTGLRDKKFDPLSMNDDEEVLGLAPYTGPEVVDTPSGPKPKIGTIVCARNLRVRTELNWRVAAKKPGMLIKRGDRPFPEGKIVGWTENNERAVVDFGTHNGEWRVRPANLCLAPPPLPPPPPPQTLYVVCEEMFAVEGQYDLTTKEMYGKPVWRRTGEDADEDDECAICADASGKWTVSFDGLPVVRALQEAHTRFPHMMGHKIIAEFEGEEDIVPPTVRWERQDVLAETWAPDMGVAIQIEKPIAREHMEVLEEMEEQVIDDIMEDLQQDLIDDLIEDLEDDIARNICDELQEDMEAELAGDLGRDLDLGLDEDIADAAADDAAEEAARAAAEAEAEAARAAAEAEAEAERERQEAEAEAERQRAEEEAERERQRAEEEAAAAKQREEEERAAAQAQKDRDAAATAEAKRKAEAEAEAERKRKEAEEAERKRKEAEDKKRKEAEDKKRKEEEEKKRKEEEARKKKEEEERKKREEAERKRKEEEERKRREEEERRRREEERKRKELLRKKAEAKRLKEEQARKARKAAKRKGKMETLNKALELGALTKMDHLAALRRLQSVTGEDPTNGDRAYTLPETMQWMSSFMEVIWPYVESLLADSLREVCAPALEEVDGNVTVENVDLGNECPAFGPISAKYLDENTPNMSVEIGLGITYNAAVDIKFKVGEHGTPTVRRLKVVGTLYFWLRPSSRAPFISCVQMAFVNPPTVQFLFEDKKGERKSIKLKQTEQVVQKAVEAAVRAKMVVPRFITIPVADDSGMGAYSTPSPQGVVKVTVVKADNLEAADDGMTSDPYVNIRIGSSSKTTSTVPRTLTPNWEAQEGALNSFNFVVYAPDQWILLDVFDEDEGQVDDHLGGVVGLPVNRLVLRCMDPDNKDGTVAIPLTRGGQPVQGEEGDVSAVTVRAEWLTIDPTELSDGESLMAVTLTSITGMPDRFCGPYRVRVSSASPCGRYSQVDTSRQTFNLDNPEPAAQVLRKIKHLAADKKTSTQISFLVGLPAPLVKEAVAMGSIEHLTDEELDQNWLATATGELEKRQSSKHLYLLDVVCLSIAQSSQAPIVKLEVLDGSGETIGFCNVEVRDESSGDEPDVSGPFAISCSESDAIQIHGHIVTNSLQKKGLPPSWNLKSKKHKALGDERKKKENQHVIDQNAGGKLTTVKEEALSDCLAAGALTWGDYDILVGKLRGESTSTSIAETLEWVNMIINPLWAKARPMLEKYIRGDMNDMFKDRVADMTSMVKVDITGADLGRAWPTFSTINVEKMRHPETDAVEGVALILNNLAYNSNIDIEMSVAGMDVRLVDMKLCATVRIEMTHLIDKAPFFGAVRVYCPNPPSENDLKISCMGGFEFGGMLKRAAVATMTTVVGQTLVTPNAINCSTLPGIPPPALQQPIGVLRLGLVRARHLLAMDVANLLRAAGSDSYVHILLGSQMKRTKTITSLDPEWLETHDLLVHNMQQSVDIEVFDDDMGREDDSMGAIFQKETVLGGGTDLIHRGIPVNALVRKSWDANDRKRPYVILPLEEKVVDEELSVRDAPYIGARITYNGKGKFEGPVTLEDGAVLNVGDEGVVEEVDKSTKPFHTFYCSFLSCGSVGLTAQDLDVREPKLVHKLQQFKGTDNEESVIHVHPEWLSHLNKGREAARMIRVELLRIEGMPALKERDMGGPFRVCVTAECAATASEEWSIVTSQPGKPEYARERVLETISRQLVSMKKAGKSDEQIADALEITEDLAWQGAEIFNAPPLKERKLGSQRKTITIAPCGHEQHGRSVTFQITTADFEDQDVTIKYMEAALGIPAGHAITLYRERADTHGAKLDPVVPVFESLTDGEELVYSMSLSHAALVWDKAARDHTDRLRSASSPYYNDSMYLIVSDIKSPTLKVGILANNQVPSGPLAEVRVQPNADGTYPDKPVEVVIKQAATGGMFGWGKKDEYEYRPKIHMKISYTPLFMQSG